MTDSTNHSLESDKASVSPPTVIEPKSLAEFLQSTAPGKAEEIGDLYKTDLSRNIWYVSAPDIQLYCVDNKCGGVRTYYQSGDRRYTTRGNIFLVYTCRNCGAESKVFALIIEQDSGQPSKGVALKLGEYPQFGPVTPARVISLIGPDRDLFLQGRRSEIQGFGIGAFAYYRRVVENQKSRMIGEISRVASRLNAGEEQIKQLERAKAETQFSKAIDEIKDAMPSVLMIEGRNPLSLLHGALSAGLHAKTDEECLKLATAIRLILTELAERISQALKDDAELKEAVSKLLSR